MGGGNLLDATAYSDPMTFQAERKAIFGTGWQMVGPSAGFTADGSYAALGLGGWPLFAIRGADGVIRAFRNVCSHQKMPVLDNGRGQCDQIRCRFHGWTYDTLGNLISAPQPVAPADGDLNNHPLEELRVEVIGGLVFVRLNASNLDKPVMPNPHAITGLAHCQVETSSLTQNWKAILDVLVDGPATPPTSENGSFSWIPPTTGLWSEPDGTVVMQVVPRTFRKTELHIHRLADSEHALDQRAADWAACILSSAAARQNAVEANVVPDADAAARLAPLHAWIGSRLSDHSA